MGRRRTSSGCSASNYRYGAERLSPSSGKAGTFSCQHEIWPHRSTIFRVRRGGLRLSQSHRRIAAISLRHGSSLARRRSKRRRSGQVLMHIRVRKDDALLSCEFKTNGLR